MGLHNWLSSQNTHCKINAKWLSTAEHMTCFMLQHADVLSAHKAWGRRWVWLQPASLSVGTVASNTLIVSPPPPAPADMPSQVPHFLLARLCTCPCFIHAYSISLKLHPTFSSIHDQKTAQSSLFSTNAHVPHFQWSTATAGWSPLSAGISSTHMLDMCS